MDSHDNLVHEVLRQQYGYTLTVGAQLTTIKYGTSRNNHDVVGLKLIRNRVYCVPGTALSTNGQHQALHFVRAHEVRQLV